MILPKSLIIDTYMYYYAYNLSSHVHFLDTQKSVGISVDNYMKKNKKRDFFFGVVNNTYRFMHELG